MTDEKIVPGTIKRVLKRAEFMSKETKALVQKGQEQGRYYPISANHEVNAVEDANIVTSMIDDGKPKPVSSKPDIFDEAGEWPIPEEVMHAPVIDLDFPHTYVPSTTPGHGHLYLDTPMDYETFLLFMETLSDFGIIEEGYWKATRVRGYSAVRLPWVQKKEDEA